MLSRGDSGRKEAFSGNFGLSVQVALDICKSFSFNGLRCETPKGIALLGEPFFIPRNLGAGGCFSRSLEPHYHTTLGCRDGLTLTRYQSHPLTSESLVIG
jgi:hypothetical protein